MLRLVLFRVTSFYGCYFVDWKLKRLGTTGLNVASDGVSVGNSKSRNIVINTQMFHCHLTELQQLTNLQRRFERSVTFKLQPTFVCTAYKSAFPAEHIIWLSTFTHLTYLSCYPQWFHLLEDTFKMKVGKFGPTSVSSHQSGFGYLFSQVWTLVQVSENSFSTLEMEAKTLWRFGDILEITPWEKLHLGTRSRPD